MLGSFVQWMPAACGAADGEGAGKGGEAGRTAGGADVLGLDGAAGAEEVVMPST